MGYFKKSSVIAALALTLVACSAPARRPLVDPFPLRFPLAEAGSLDIDGRIVGQPLARDGVVYFATSDGYQTAIVISSRSVLWRHLGQEGTGDSTDRPVKDGQKPPILRAEGNRLQALDGEGRPIWAFTAEGTISAGPAVSERRLYFGTESRRFYCLKAGTGKAVWSRRLQGAPLHPAILRRGVVAVPASNSVVYFLSARGGSILSWETISSRVIHPLAAAGPLVLVSSASPDVTAFEIKTGKRVGQYAASGPLVAGAVWTPPYIVLFVENGESGRQRIVFLRSR
jgi:outer membrane protein assembly factor BamB